MTALRIALEITPPRERRTEILLRRARLLGARASSVHVIERRERQPSVEAALELRQHGIAAVWHLVSRGQSESDCAASIERAARGGLRSALVVRGEPGPAEVTPPPTLVSLVRRLREADPGGRIGVTADPYAERQRVERLLAPKLEAGADFVQTQPVFALATLAPLAESIRRRIPRVEIVPMLIPLLSVASAERLGERLRVPLPETLLHGLEREGEPFGWRAFAALVAELGRSGLCDALAVMTQEADPPKAFAERLSAALDSSHSP
jgi:5,10-methylenetetrahydrofolate reductase